MASSGYKRTLLEGARHLVREGGLHTLTPINMRITRVWDRHCLKWFRKASKDNENTNSKRYMHPYVCHSIICSSQDTEAT